MCGHGKLDGTLFWKVGGREVGIETFEILMSYIIGKLKKLCAFFEYFEMIKVLRLFMNFSKLLKGPLARYFKGFFDMKFVSVYVYDQEEISPRF